MSDTTNYCKECKVRQDKLDELEAALIDVESGNTIVAPVDYGHAKAMILVATMKLRELGE